MIIIHMTPCTM